MTQPDCLIEMRLELSIPMDLGNGLAITTKLCFSEVACIHYSVREFAFAYMYVAIAAIASK